MADIIKEILKILPQDKISDAVFEGANIVLYTKNKEFFFDNKGSIKKAVDEFKKRIELRPDPSVTMKVDEAEVIIKSMIPEDSGLSQIIFDPQRSHVVLEVEKPGIAIGKQGAILQDIKEKTLWVPVVRRTPALKCDLINDIRNVLYVNSDERRKFLDKVGHRIYDGWTRGKKDQWVRVTYLGSGRQCGRSCILLQTPESRILLDCGMDVSGDDSSAFPYFECPEFRINELDAIIVSHSHIDHCALVPLLYKYGFKGAVYCTEPTRDTMSLLQLDTVKIMKGEGKEPLYTAEDIKEMVKHTITLDFEEVTDITPDVRITFYNSGHVLGGAMVHLHIGNGLHNLLYTSDMKFLDSHLLQKAVTKFPRLETLMIESTYGSKERVIPDRLKSEEELSHHIIETVKRGGKVLMPVLGTGRAQEVMLVVEKLIKDKKMPEIPVYIDGMVWDITAIHTTYPEFMNVAMRKRIFQKDTNPFLEPFFKQVGSQKERKKIIEDEGPALILATSGMLNGGPSLQYFKELANGKKHTIIFTSYLGPGTIGQRLHTGEREFNFSISRDKQEVLKVAMDVVKLDGFSGHAGHNELINFFGKLNPRPRKVLINHGEPKACLELAATLHKMYKVETLAPRNLEAIRLK